MPLLSPLRTIGSPNPKTNSRKHHFPNYADASCSSDLGGGKTWSASSSDLAAVALHPLDPRAPLPVPHRPWPSFSRRLSGPSCSTSTSTTARPPLRTFSSSASETTSRIPRPPVHPPTCPTHRRRYLLLASAGSSTTTTASSTMSKRASRRRRATLRMSAAGASPSSVCFTAPTRRTSRTRSARTSATAARVCFAWRATAGTRMGLGFT